MFQGDRGMLLADYGKHMLLPQDKYQDFQRPDPFIPDSLGHHREWIHACKHGTKPCSDFPGSAAPLSAFAAPGHLAAFAGVGKKLKWDVRKMKCTNDSEINSLVHREYRPGWEV